MDIYRGQDSDGLRWYSEANSVQDAINTDRRYMSVTTVLGFLDEDTTGLERWKDKNDGTDDRPHHEHIYWYSAPRGTLCHYQALCKFEDAFDNDEDMWGEEEGESMQQIIEGPADGTFDDASHDLEDITYSILKNQNVVSSRDEYDAILRGNTRLVDVLHEDIDYFVDAFETICDELGVTEENVIRVEKFLLNDSVGYGGQCDLLYEDQGGNNVVADLKTSSSLRHKHRLQSVAYMKAVEQAEWGPDEIDRVEVWRIHPDTETWQVHASSVPEHATRLYDEDSPETADYTDEHWYVDNWGEFAYDSLDEMWETFSELATDAHEHIND